MHDFRQRWADRRHAVALEQLLAHRPEAVSALRFLVANDDATHPQLFDCFTEVVAAFDLNCALAYSDYVRASLDKTLGSQLAIQGN